MNTYAKRWARVPAAALLTLLLGASLPALVHSQSVPPGGVTELPVDNDDDHMMLTWLSVALNDYANAMTKWLVDAARENGGRVSVRALQRFQRQLRTATFAYFEYSYDIGNERYSRVYLAVSGRPFRTYIEPRFPGLVAPVAPDEDYFPSDDVIRHATPGAVEGSDVTPRPNRPNIPNRGNDAEIKVLQSIMRDIEQGLVTRGGRLVGFVSKQPCESCSPALRQFSRETGSEVHVNYVHGANEIGLRTPAWTAFTRARESLIEDLVTLMTAPVAGQPAPAEHPSGNEQAPPTVCHGAQIVTPGDTERR